MHNLVVLALPMMKGNNGAVQQPVIGNQPVPAHPQNIIQQPGQQQPAQVQQPAQPNPGPLVFPAHPSTLPKNVRVHRSIYTEVPMILDPQVYITAYLAYSQQIGDTSSRLSRLPIEYQRSLLSHRTNVVAIDQVGFVSTVSSDQSFNFDIIRYPVANYICFAYSVE